MKHTLKGWLSDSNFTNGKKVDQLLRLEPTGNLTLADVFDEMRKEDTGLRTETIEHAVKLFNRVVARLVMNGYSVNTELFRAVPQCRGVIENGQWNPEKNSIRVSFIQDKEIREAIAETSVHILGEKGDVMYITGGEDTATHATDGTATAGRTYILSGRMIKIAGDHESVGLTLTGDDGAVTRIAADMVSINTPRRIVFLLPADLAEGSYTLTITTQYSGKRVFLKTPRVTARTIVVSGLNTCVQPFSPSSANCMVPP